MNVHDSTPKKIVIRRGGIFAGLVLLIASLLSGGLDSLAANASGVDASPTIGAQYFASEVQTLGQTSYPNTFAGAEVFPNDSVSIYTTSIDPEFAQKVTALDQGNYTVAYVVVPESISQLQSETTTMSNGFQSLSGFGIHPTLLNPDPSSGNIDVTLAQPTSADLAAMQGAGVGPVSMTNFISQAQTIVSAHFGQQAVVSHQFGNEAHQVSSRYNDSPPWTGGDSIYGPASCTSGFGVTGNASGHSFVLTAGHCGSGYWYADGGNMIGSTSSGGQYWLDSGGNDFQTISTPFGLQGRVWWGTSNIHPVNGYVIPAINSDITFDGAVTGEAPDAQVFANNAAVKIYTQDGVYITTLYHQVEADNSTYYVCGPGDSGGPMYQREPGTSDVNAVAIMNGCQFTQGGPNQGHSGDGEQIAQIMSVSNTSLVYGT